MKEIIKIRNNATNEIMELTYTDLGLADKMEYVLEFIGADYSVEFVENV